MQYKHLLLLTFVFTAISATCQEKFIEVIVSDTMWVNPNQYVYTITTNTSMFDVADTAPGNSQLSYQKQLRSFSANQKQMADAFKKVLLKKKFTVLPEPVTSEFTSKEDAGINSFAIITSTIDSLRMLYDLIKGGGSFFGAVTSRTSTNEDACQQTLFKRIISKARQKAEVLAGLGKMQLAQVISIKESPTEQEGWTAYPPLSALQNDVNTSIVPGWHTTIYPRRYYDLEPDAGDQYQIKNTLVVRFAVQ